MFPALATGTSCRTHSMPRSHAPAKELDKLMSFSGTPTVVWRRTGEICLVAPEFCMLTEWSMEDLLPADGRKKYIYEVRITIVPWCITDFPSYLRINRSSSIGRTSHLTPSKTLHRAFIATAYYSSLMVLPYPQPSVFRYVAICSTCLVPLLVRVAFA